MPTRAILYLVLAITIWVGMDSYTKMSIEMEKTRRMVIQFELMRGSMMSHGGSDARSH